MKHTIQLVVTTLITVDVDIHLGETENMTSQQAAQHIAQQGIAQGWPKLGVCCTGGGRESWTREETDDMEVVAILNEHRDVWDVVTDGALYSDK